MSNESLNKQSSYPEDFPQEIDFSILENYGKEANNDKSGTKKPEGRPEKSNREKGFVYLDPDENAKTPVLAEMLHRADSLIPEEKKEEWDKYIENNTVGYTYNKGKNIHRFSPKTCKKIVDVLEKLNNPQNNLTDILDQLRDQNESESEKVSDAILVEAAFKFSEKGPALKLLDRIDTYLPEKTENASQLTPNSGLTSDIAIQTSKNSQKKTKEKRRTKQFLTNLRNGIAKIPELYSKTKNLISDNDQRAWKEALCVDALSGERETSLNSAVKIMQALDDGINVTELNESEKTSYNLADESVRGLVLHFSKYGPAFYQATLPKPFSQLSNEEKKYCVNPEQAAKNREAEIERQKSLISEEINRRKEARIEFLNLPEKPEKERIRDKNKQAIIRTLLSYKPNYKRVVDSLNKLERRDSLRKSSLDKGLSDSEKNELEELENIEEFKELDYHDVCKSAYGIKHTGKELIFIRNAEIFMPMDETKKESRQKRLEALRKKTANQESLTSTEKEEYKKLNEESFLEGWRKKQLPHDLALRVLAEKKSSAMTLALIDDALKKQRNPEHKTPERLIESYDDFDSYKNAIEQTSELWQKSKNLVKPEYLEQFREILCRDAIGQNPGAKTKHAIALMTAIENGENILEKDEDNEFIYALEDKEVLDIILHYSKEGIKFYDKLIKASPKTNPISFKAQKEKLALEIALVTTNSNSYDDIPQNILSEARKYIDKRYSKPLKTAA